MDMRQTGRTTSMLLYAASMKDRGERVLVVIFPQQRWYVERLIREHRLSLTPHDLCTPDQAVETRMRGMNPNNVFMDHFVYERCLDRSSRPAYRFVEELSTLQRQWPRRIAEQIPLQPYPDEFCDCRLH